MLEAIFYTLILVLELLSGLGIDIPLTKLHIKLYLKIIISGIIGGLCGYLSTFIYGKLVFDNPGISAIFVIIMPFIIGGLSGFISYSYAKKRKIDNGFKHFWIAFIFVFVMQLTRIIIIKG